MSVVVEGPFARVVRRRAWLPVRCRDGRLQWLKQVYYEERCLFRSVSFTPGTDGETYEDLVGWTTWGRAPYSAAGYVAWRLEGVI